MAVPRAGADSPREIHWDGVTAERALRDCAAALNRPLTIDETALQRTRETRVNLSAQHLDHENAMRWAARLAGLECRIERAHVFVTWPDGRPMDADSISRAGENDPRRNHAVDLNLSDVTLSECVRVLRKEYAVDIYLSPDIAACQELISLTMARCPLKQAIAEVCRQTRGQARMIDGMLALDALPAAGAAPVLASRFTARALTKEVTLCLSGRPTWREVVEKARAAQCDVEMPKDWMERNVGILDADGPSAAVIEVLLLSEGLNPRRLIRAGRPAFRVEGKRPDGGK